MKALSDWVRDLCGGRRRLLQIAAAAMIVAMTIQGRAAEDRAIKSRVAPVYPELAKRMKISGVVKVEVTIDADGKVTDAKTLSGSRVLAGAAEDAVKKWKFVAGDGEAKVNVDITFALSQ
jgi:TonB family protein